MALEAKMTVDVLKFDLAFEINELCLVIYREVFDIES